MAFEIGASAIASVLGMIWRFLEDFLPGGQIIKIVSNIVVAGVVVILAFGAIFSGASLSLLTGNIFVAFVFFLGVGYAAASLIADLIGL